MRLLLVEDDPELGPQLKAALQQAGYAVDLATDGLDAEALGDIEPYDLAVLDLGLPRRPGLQVLANWRGRGNRLPVVVLTARGSWQEKVEGFKAIGAVLKRSQGAAVGALSFDGLTLDEDKQLVRLPDGAECVLTGTEFRLLRYFMLHPGQVLSKTRLTEHVYEYDADRDSNVIEVYINRLRQKIGLERIQTRRGQGYVFTDGAA